jgi:hypothetical protein
MPDVSSKLAAALAAVLLGAIGCGGATSDPAASRWRPAAGASWQWQLSGAVDTSLPVAVYDIDWESDGAVVAALHALGRRAICYVNVGAWEDWRPDAAEFPAGAIGADYPGWPGEKFLDIRSAQVRAVLERRFDTCRAKAFDAIEPDNMDVFELGAASGFPLTTDDGIAYARWLAGAAHRRGLGIGQKNAASITGAVHPSFDWALSEGCYADGNWCPDFQPYLDAGRPVFMCEYQAATFAAACSWAVPRGYSPILKGLDLGAPVTFCP